METNIAPGLRFAILDHEFKLRLAERANKMDLTVSQRKEKQYRLKLPLTMLTCPNIVKNY